jgi:hypothetical protein
MGMRDRVARALGFPFQDTEWLSKIGIGGGVGLAAQALFVAVGFLLSRELALEASPLALLVNFPVLGFVLQVFRGALNVPRADAMPEWKRWPRLFLAGLLVFVLGLGYGALPLLLIIWGSSLLVRGGAALVSGLVMMLLGLLAGLTLGFFIPMAVARYLEQRRLEAALHPIVVWAGIRRVLAEYLAAYLLGIGSFIVVGLVGAVPYLGPLAWPFVAFYLLVAGARLFGEICAPAG